MCVVGRAKTRLERCFEFQPVCRNTLDFREGSPEVLRRGFRPNFIGNRRLAPQCFFVLAAKLMSHDDAEFAPLPNAQRMALQHVGRMATRQQADALARLTKALRSTGCTQGMLDEAMESVRHDARVVLHFHPDRIGVKPITVAEALLQEGRYRNQFETGLSTGSRTAFPGGDRDTWEIKLFGGAYHTSESTIVERPKYGALELIRHPDGPWPRFKSEAAVWHGIRLVKFEVQRTRVKAESSLSLIVVVEFADPLREVTNSRRDSSAKDCHDISAM